MLKTNIDLAFHWFLFTIVYIENICEVMFICEVQTKIFSMRCVFFVNRIATEKVNKWDEIYHIESYGGAYLLNLFTHIAFFTENILSEKFYLFN